MTDREEVGRLGGVALQRLHLLGLDAMAKPLFYAILLIVSLRETFSFSGKAHFVKLSRKLNIGVNDTQVLLLFPKLEILPGCREVIDFERRTLTLEGDSSPFHEFDLETNIKHLEPGVFAVHAQSSFIIPPCTEIIVPGELDSSCVVTSTALLQPRPELPERYQIMGAAQLVKVSNNTFIPVRLLNPTSQPIHIYRRTKLAEISLVDPEIATYELVRSDLEAEANRDIPTAVDAEPRVPLDVGNVGLTQTQRTRLQALLTRDKKADSTDTRFDTQIHRAAVQMEPRIHRPPNAGRNIVKRSHGIDIDGTEHRLWGCVGIDALTLPCWMNHGFTYHSLHFLPEVLAGQSVNKRVDGGIEQNHRVRNGHNDRAYFVGRIMKEAVQHLDGAPTDCEYSTNNS
ncbi:hypothetical protein P5673_032849 [Acropora cervicornis]|uniref:Uncharacterized protein n=1 Tax=Acropora cervicornis TaxID=6130 RepID=A0AAD9PQS8_ACRCE|nr:hypothetical protein P5673_032849 [Acropora cervicornis]